MANWFVTAKKADFDEIAKKHNISPIIARILRNRDIISDEEISLFLHGTIANLYNPYEMKDMDLAVNLMEQAIKMHRRIRIIGDYDIDGICATYILLEGLTKCGAVVDAKLPDRIKDGYGISDSMICSAYEDEIEVILTCDNGIAAIEQIAHAKELGMTVIIMDHHEILYNLAEDGSGTKQYILPSGDAVINPHRADCNYPFPGVCGAVVAYKVIQALWEALMPQEDVVEAFLSFAAFATIGDVMELRDENRIIVKYGMEKIKKSKNIGMRALISSACIDKEKLSPYHIGFILGPCINATGRLDTAERALSLFISKNEKEASKIALELKELNESRKDMTQHFLEQAVKELEKCEDKVLVLYLAECHESLAGIIAGRIKERYYKPTFILTKGEKGVKGSGRSIEAYHMYDEMTKCKDLFSKYGGHKMAAGLSMPEENIEKFRIRLNQNTDLKDEDMIEKVRIDIPLPIGYANEALISEIELLAPFGMGNSRPLFAEKELLIRSMQIIGKNHNVVKMSLQNKDGVVREAIWFGDSKTFLKKTGDMIAITYYPTLNVYMGNSSVQLTIQHYD